MEFSKITYQPLNGPLAQVDRSTLELFIDDEKWNRISKLEHGDLYKEFILLHESGHITLQDSSEFSANRFAIKKFLRKIAELSNDELGMRVIVLSDLLENDFQGNVLYKVSNISKMEGGADPYSAAAGGALEFLTSVFNNLPLLGVGSKARRKEIEAQAQGQAELARIQGKTIMNAILIGGFLLLIIFAVWFTFKNK